MKKLLFTSLFLLFSFNSFSKVLVVSDLDDTVKMSGIGDHFELLTNYAFGVKPFPHLIGLYYDIEEHYNNQGEEVEFVYLTSAPELINSQQWIIDNNLPSGTLIQRTNRALLNPFGNASKNYKIRALTKVLSEASYSEILLFGDNGENDPVIYDTVTRDLGLENVSIYIRDISARASVCHEAIEGITYFLHAGQLTSGDFNNIAGARLKEDIQLSIEDATLLPDFVIERYIDLKRDNCR